MKKFERTLVPDILKNKWESFGERYAKNRDEKPNFTFQWTTINGKKLNHYLLPPLKAMTDNHCSYCDGFPRRGDDQIDHFCPKSKEEFYRIAYKWENLYVTCAGCQGHNGKGEQYDEMLLRPDDDNYSFGKYFTYEYATGRIVIREDIDEKLKQNAETTLRIFNLNHKSLTNERRNYYDLYHSKNNPDLSDFPYRFLFE